MIWLEALDALDEWVRRTADGVAMPPPRLPADDLPSTLRWRAQVLAAAMRDLEADLLLRRDELSRRQAYGAA